MFDMSAYMAQEVVEAVYNMTQRLEELDPSPLHATDDARSVEHGAQLA
jgi:hypothetical protein